VKVTYADGNTRLAKASEFKRRRQRRPKTFYEHYLRSPHWKALRAQALERDGWACTGCGARHDEGAVLHVHHLTYERMPNRELLADVVTLCKSCHGLAHVVP
jgi:5-methylcytosine-specific restriction endonuclease McrA